MAEAPATSNGVIRDSAVLAADKQGWLSKRTQFTHRWKPVWFVLKETQLLYGENEKEAQKKINLLGAHVKEVDGNEMTFTWTITPKGGKRTFFLKANSESEQREWIQAICDALVKSSAGHASSTCTVQ
ncbi:pleckstrin homology-like domain-containing protein [Polyodon spathula]|uniref:pleckstrin homology-like domain-containing protein n=1 Tax=Polyodon spathula TaxID=7913 RepID=UPI001B7EAECD|nr:pleckstrin homology-like domain-containing protein [Polyodon spathula]